MYAATDAVGSTSAELLALGHDLLGTPVPLVAVVGVWLLLAPRLTRGVRLVAAWALLPVLASALYWHHDLVFGPRMLGEAAPAWCALAVLSVGGLARLVRERPRVADAVVLGAVLALAWAPVRGIPDILGRYPPRLGIVPEPPESEPSLVFVHESWADRQGGLLSGRGLRLDSVRALLTRYPPCQIEAALRGIGPEEAAPHCWREQASDGPFLAALQAGRGVEGLTALLWPNDLPGLPAEGVLWARDLGPERNRALIARHPARVPYVLVPPLDEESPWNFLPYEQGIGLIWPPLDAAPPRTRPPPQTPPPPD